MFDLLVRNAEIVPAGEKPYRGSIAVQGQHIAGLLPADTDIDAQTIIDADGLTLIPGVIDPHTHIRYNTGYGDDSQQYRTETQSALLGGVTIRFSDAP